MIFRQNNAVVSAVAVAAAAIVDDIKSEAEPNSSVIAEETPKNIVKEETNISRSGRVIKKKKFLIDEFDETPAPPAKRKRPSESLAPITKARKVNLTFHSRNN